MKALNSLLVVITGSLLESVTSNELVFCGSEPCQVVLQTISCEELIENYDLQGSCCSMESLLPAYDGCRITVSGNSNGSNCYWTPKCAECDINDADIMCARVYTSESPDRCPDSDYPTYWEKNIEDSCEPSVAPSSMPSEFSSAPNTVMTVGAVSTIISLAIVVANLQM